MPHRSGNDPQSYIFYNYDNTGQHYWRCAESFDRDGNSIALGFNPETDILHTLSYSTIV